MKLKCQPEDFRVTELTAFQADGGPFALYRLTKRSIGTPEAIQQICRQLHLHRRRVCYGGLKDKHALTRQFVTIEGGPRRNFEKPGLFLEYQGQTSRHFVPHDIAGNRFQIVLRDLSEAELQRAENGLKEVEAAGLPNYFDDQRFGSLGQSGEFIGAPWCRGDYERALWLAIADGHADDRAADKQQKQILRECWGQWATCKERLERSTARSIVTFLVDHPTDFRRAFALLDVDLRGLYLSALQSALWNRAASSLLFDESRNASAGGGQAARQLRCSWGNAVFPMTLPADVQTRLEGTQLPLPSARNLQELGVYTDLFTSLAAEFGLELRELRVKFPRDSFFSKGERSLLILPRAMRYDSAADDLYPGRHQLGLEFELPRGSYATILVKRISEV